MAHLFHPSPAVAQSTTNRTQLVYVNGAGMAKCPTEAALRSSVMTNVGYDPFTSRSEEQLIVRIVRIQGGLRGEVRLLRGSEEAGRPRIFLTRADDCVELAKTLALAMSIAINSLPTAPSNRVDPSPSEGESRASVDSRAAIALPSPTSSSVAPRDPDEATPPADTPAPRDVIVRSTEERDRPRSPVRLVPRLGVGVLFSSGLLPAPGPGGLVALGVGYGPFSFDAEGRLDASQSSAHGAGTIEISTALVTLAPCWHMRWLALCGLATGGTLRGTGRGYDVTYEGTGPLWAAGVRAAVGYSLSKTLELSALVDGEAILARTRFTVDRATAWRLRPMTFGGAVAAYVHFR